MTFRLHILAMTAFSAFLFMSCSTSSSNWAYDSLFDVDLEQPSPDAEVFLPTSDDDGSPSGGDTGPSGDTPSDGGVSDPVIIQDPFDGGDPPAEGFGLRARLYYFNPDPTSEERAQGFSMFMSSPSSHEIANPLILSRLNRPTVGWLTGFEYAPGEFVSFVNEDGEEERLVEWFGFIANTKIVLTESDPAGEYEFVVLSDDGFIMEISQNGVPNTIIDHDGTHPTTLGCGSQTVNLQSGQELETRFAYYQGPRQHIAFVLLWRTGSNLPQETECGNGNNNYWFLGDGDSSPTQKYQELLGRGWQVLTAENYLLPD